MFSIFQFFQDAVLKEALLGTEGTTMVEAAPRDTIWGIGLGAKILSLTLTFQNRRVQTVYRL